MKNKDLAEQMFGPGTTGNYRWRGIDHSTKADETHIALSRVADGHMIIIDDPLVVTSPAQKEAALKWLEKTMREHAGIGTIIAHAGIPWPRQLGRNVVNGVIAEMKALRLIEDTIASQRFLGTCVRVIRNVGRSDFPDIDQMLQDLQGLPSPDDPLYEVSLSHG